MKIEDELKMDSFEGNYHKAMLNILYTANWITEQLKESTKKEEITPQQYNILRILRGQYPKPSSINLIRDKLMDKMSDVSRLVDRLEKKRLVSRNISCTDRRTVDIALTKLGFAKLEKLDTPMKVGAILDKNLNEKECETLSLLLDRIREKK